MNIRVLIITLAALASAIPSAFALDAINSTGAGHLAIRGTDTTAYFRKAGPIEGQRSHVVLWKGATWRFASAEDAALFRANPTAYAPQFGAYCTGGLSQRHVVEGKPRNWRIHKGKLYLFYSSAGAKRFTSNPDETIRKAQAYWTTLSVEE